MGKKINRENLLEHLVEKQFNLIEKTTLDTIFNKNFKEEWFINKLQFEKFQKYAILTMMKVLKISKNKAKVNFEWFWKRYGLNIK